MDLDSVYWRVREEAYRAIARSCSDPRTRDNWLGLASACAARALEIEQLALSRSPAGEPSRMEQQGSARPGASSGPTKT
jgi:hypothetical protein